MHAKILIVLVAFTACCGIARAENKNGYRTDLGVLDTPWGKLHSYEGMKASSMVAPIYPSTARDARITGMVALAALVGEDGTVKDVKIMRSSGNDDLDRSALAALTKWKYRPLTPRERFVTLQPVSFDLQ